MDDRLHLAVERFAAHPFDGAEHDLGAVQRGYGEKVEHGEVDADVRRDLEELLHAARGDLGGEAYGGDRPAEGVQPQMPRKQLPQHLENGAADAERVAERARERFEKAELITDGVDVKRRSALPLLLRDAEGAPERGGVRQVLELRVCAQHDGNFRDLSSLSDPARNGEVGEVALPLAFERLHEVGRHVHRFPLAGEEDVSVLQRKARGHNDAALRQAVG